LEGQEPLPQQAPTRVSIRANEARMSSIPIPPRLGVPVRPTRILAIDDDRVFLEMLGHLLRRADLELRTADGGLAGLDQALSWDPDVILLDLRMPGVDGREFLVRYRTSSVSPAPVILLTADGDGSSHARTLGLAAFLAKPFELDDLIALLAIVSRDGHG
jgi:DNA-binding response OmpR family regulator